MLGVHTVYNAEQEKWLDERTASETSDWYSQVPERHDGFVENEN